jgi:hypothetical protein
MACFAGLCPGGRAQSSPRNETQPEAAPQSVPADSAERPLPNIPALMHDVEANQRKAETVEKDYIFHSIVTEHHTDGHGQTKKTTVDEYDIYWLHGVRVRRQTKKNGKDLSPEEIAKENDRIEKEAAKAHERREKADTGGKETDSRGDEEITVSRLLELGAFTNPRRVKFNGRDTIAVDYAGDPKARTRNRSEEVIRDMVGTAWVDEQDHVLSRAEGRFVNNFKIGGGLVVDIKQDTHFAMQMAKINGEVWLPARIEAQGAMRALLLFSFSGDVAMAYSDYRKFRTTSTILPGVAPVEDQHPAPEPLKVPPSPPPL